jgi:hypothetical protein
MGRGRAKAKQAKVARQLKYSGGGTDLDRLRAELGVGAGQREAGGQDALAGDGYPADDEDDDAQAESADDDAEYPSARGMYRSGARPGR